MIAEEQAAAGIGVVLWPEREGREPRRSGDSCPHLLPRLAAVLRSHVDQQLTVRREIRSIFVDATVEPPISMVHGAGSARPAPAMPPRE